MLVKKVENANICVYETQIKDEKRTLLLIKIAAGIGIVVGALLYGFGIFPELLTRISVSIIGGFMGFAVSAVLLHALFSWKISAYCVYIEGECIEILVPITGKDQVAVCNAVKSLEPKAIEIAHKRRTLETIVTMCK